MKSASDDTPLPTITWQCTCGGLSFAHQMYCGKCGENKPLPKVEKKK
jgi:hypothetical protein